MKKRSIKNLSLLAAALIGTSFLTGCGSTKNSEVKGEKEVDANFNETGYPVVKEKIELNAIASISSLNSDFNEMELIQTIDDKTGVEVKYDCISSNVWTEKKNLLLASGDLPDFFIGGGLSDSDITKGAAAGQFLPLDDLLEKYAPNIMKLLNDYPDVKKAITFPDGHIYTLPYFDEYTTDAICGNLFVNKKWLDNLGLDVPTTTDEFKAMLKAFKEKDPNGNGKNDEIPFSYMNDSGCYGEQDMFGAFGVIDTGDRLMLKDGKVIFTPLEEGWKDAVKWFRELYTEGLTDKEVFTQDYGQYVGKGKSDDTVLGAFVKYFPENMVGAEKAHEEYVAIPPLKGPNGDQLWGRGTGKGYYQHYFALTNKNESPEATIRWIDEWYTEEFSIQSHWGPVGTNLELKDGKYVFTTPPDGMSADQYRYVTAPAARAPGFMTAKMYDSMVMSKDREDKKERTQMYLQYAVKEFFPYMRYTQEELDELSIIKTDILNYVKEMKAKWVTGERDIDKDWSEFESTLKKMQVDRYLEIVQATYERCK